MIDPRVASGLRDIPPSVMIPRERMLARFRETFAAFGFVPIETPHIERMEVLTGKGAGLRRGPPADLRGHQQGGHARRARPAVRPDRPPGPVRRQARQRAGRAVQAVRDRLGLPRRAARQGAVPRVRPVRLRHRRHRERRRRRRDGPGDPRRAGGGRGPRVHDHAQQPQDPRRPARHARASPTGPGPSCGRSTSSRRSAATRSLAELHGRSGRARTTGRASARGSPDRPGAGRVLDFVEQGRGGIEVLTRAESELGDHPRAAEGIANLRDDLRPARRGGRPAGPAQDRPRPGARARLLHGGRLRDDRRRLGAVRQRQPRGAGTTTSRACSPTAGCPASGRRSGSTGCSP